MGIGEARAASLPTERVERERFRVARGAGHYATLESPLGPASFLSQPSSSPGPHEQDIG